MIKCSFHTAIARDRLNRRLGRAEPLSRAYPFPRKFFRSSTGLTFTFSTLTTNDGLFFFAFVF
uniref:Uncharacterized protein n=1 Tax=Lepeophtheirus salmonis TaxID=72036 RepID=A0A0K2T2B5_LEPSM